MTVNGVIRPILVAGLLFACGSPTRSTTHPSDHERSRPQLEPASAPPSGANPSPFEQEHQPPSFRRTEPADCARVLWCASGGAALVGDPVLDAQERVYVATSDGYLHAFERDGRFRFSYTVEGTPQGSVSLRASDGVILLGTTAGLIYAINQSGHLHWKHQTPSAVWSGLYGLNERAVTFLGVDWRLYALSNAGAALYRVRAPLVPTTEPVVGPHDVVWVGMTDSVARFVAAYRLERIPLAAPSLPAGPVEQIVTIGDYAVARASGRAYWIVSGQDTIPLGAAEQLGSDRKRVALISGERMRMLGSPTTAHHSAVKTPQLIPVESDPIELGHGSVSGEVTLLGGQTFVPRSSGSVSIFDATEAVCHIDVFDAPARRPIVGSSGSYIAVADQLGRFCALTIEAKPVHAP